tara:strand:- start:394 stop:2418 length:2025 start_codon:yes stop_codon:yes gene_type:complete
MLVDFGRASLLGKVRQQPQRVREVLDKVRSDGLFPTLEAVQAKLDSEIPLGYCNAGVVEAVGAGVSDFAVGERVASNGPHAEMVVVPHRLCARIPDEVADEEAAFTVLGSIALQGIRLASPNLGEAVVVVGLGLIGLLSIQMLKAAGCRVLGVDLDPSRCELARSFGVEAVCPTQGGEPVAAAMALSGGHGVDAVLLTAATSSSEPVHQAAQMSRRRGRIILVGVTGLELNRADFYEKELSFQVSCSYGPGRYDAAYEEQGNDYPFGFVRWTEQRNFQAVLQLLAGGGLQTGALITHRQPIGEAVGLYRALADGEQILGALLSYPQAVSGEPGPLARLKERQVVRKQASGCQISVVGAGNFTSRVMLPNLARTEATPRTIVSSGGVSAAKLADKFGFERSSTDVEQVFGDVANDAVVITTRHDSHAGLACRALAAGQAVFVEKPLALTEQELDEVIAAWSDAEAPLLMVGFNRRFAPQVQYIKELVAALEEPFSMVMTVNAGLVPDGSWIHDPQAGGGRIVGEGCHFIDLLRFLADSKVSSCQVATLGRAGGLRITEDKASITLQFANGCMGTVHYLGNGSKAFPKERLEVFGGGRVLQLDNFKSLQAWSWPGFRKMSLRRQDKGHLAAISAFVDALRSGAEAPIPFDQIVEVSRLSIMAAELARTGGGSAQLG